MSSPLPIVLRKRKLNYCLLIVTTLASCSIETDCGGGNVSASLEDAKQRGFFVARLVPSKTTFTLPNGQSVTIKQAWLEKSWGRSCEQHKDVAYDYKQIIVAFRDSQGLMDTYGVGGSKEGSFGRYGDKAQITVSGDSVQTDYKAFVFSLEDSAPYHRRVVDSVYLKPVYQ